MCHTVGLQLQVEGGLLCWRQIVLKIKQSCPQTTNTGTLVSHQERMFPSCLFLGQGWQSHHQGMCVASWIHLCMPFKCLKNIPAPVPVPAKRIQQCESHKVHAHHLSHIPLSVRTCHTHYCSELWCFTNPGSSVILYRMKKDSTVSGWKRLWQSAGLMWISCLYSKSAFPPSTATFSACNDDLSLKFNSKLYPINVIASLDGFQEQWFISSGLSFFLAKSQATCYSDLLTHVNPIRKKKDARYCDDTDPILTDLQL